MKYGFITLTVRNMEESLAFYKEVLQLEEAIRFSPRPGSTIVFLKDAHNNKIELIHHGEAAEASEEKGKYPVSIGFEVESVEKTVQMLGEKQIPIVSGPIQTPGGQKFVFIKDPNDVEIEFIEGFTL